MTTCGIFFVKFRLVQSLALMAIVVFNASGVKVPDTNGFMLFQNKP